MSHTICTFNANNLFLRYRFGDTFPGDISGKSRAAEATETAFGFLPLNQPANFEIFAPEMRELAAKALRRGGTKLPDIVCLQEIESLLALRAFNERSLGGAYEHALLIDSRDLRQIDVGILSRLPILDVRTHMDTPDAGAGKKDAFLFSRDCLEVVVALNKSGSQRLTLFINHLKSKLARSAAERKRADDKRTRQAAGVVEIVRERFAGAEFGRALFAVVGDFNDQPDSAPVRALARAAGLVSALDRLPRPEDRWTHYFSSGASVSQLDHILLSPALDTATRSSLPVIERRGVGFATVLADGKPGPRKVHFEEKDGAPSSLEIDFRFPRFPGVNSEIDASDHCPVFFDVP